MDINKNYSISLDMCVYPYVVHLKLLSTYSTV